MGQGSLKSCMMWPISQGASPAAGRSQQSCALTAVGCSISLQKTWGTRPPLLPGSPQLWYKTEPSRDGALILAQRVVRAFPQVKKQTVPSYSTGNTNKTESKLLVFCKQGFHSKKLNWLTSKTHKNSTLKLFNKIFLKHTGHIINEVNDCALYLKHIKSYP